jgi:hypothetical protein
MADGDVGEACEPSPHDNVDGPWIVLPTEMAAKAGARVVM